jgi:NAD(P)-dependent dehydrogenase (short-subunit alcohol dehydrogenase family)
VSERDDVERWVAAVESELGPVDLLVNNAGVGGEDGPAWETEPEAWWRTFEINVRGPFLMCRAVLPGMIERGHGRIVNVASGAAYLPLGAGDG